MTNAVFTSRKSLLICSFLFCLAVGVLIGWTFSGVLSMGCPRWICRPVWAVGRKAESWQWERSNGLVNGPGRHWDILVPPQDFQQMPDGTGRYPFSVDPTPVGP